MLALFKLLFGSPQTVRPSVDSEEARAAAATAARARLEEKGLLQVELAAQAEIKKRVEAPRDSRESRSGARVAA